jgi:hypothetical protein
LGKQEKAYLEVFVQALGIFFSETSKDNIVVLMHSMHALLIKGEKQEPLNE